MDSLRERYEETLESVWGDRQRTFIVSFQGGRVRGDGRRTNETCRANALRFGVRILKLIYIITPAHYASSHAKLYPA